MTQRRPQDRPSAEAVAEAFRRILVDGGRRGRGRPVGGGGDRAAAVRRYNVARPGRRTRSSTGSRVLAVRLLRVDGAVVAVADEDRALVRARAGDAPGRRPTLYVDGELERGARPARRPRRRAAAHPPLLGAADGFRSYASAPITTHDGMSIGVAAAFGRGPRSFAEQELATLRDIADMAMHEIELRRAVRRHLIPASDPALDVGSPISLTLLDDGAHP